MSDLIYEYRNMELVQGYEVGALVTHLNQASLDRCIELINLWETELQAISSDLFNELVDYYIGM